VRIIRWAILGLGTAAVVAAAFGRSALDVKPQAEALVSRQFAARASGDVAGALALYGDVFYQATPREQWTQMLSGIEKKLGRPGAAEPAGFQVFFGAKRAGLGSYVTLQYEVSYGTEKAREIFVVFRAPSAEEPSIVGHQILSDALLDEAFRTP
jgi:hypothetical protein